MQNSAFCERHNRRLHGGCEVFDESFIPSRVLQQRIQDRTNRIGVSLEVGDLRFIGNDRLSWWSQELLLWET